MWIEFPQRTYKEICLHKLLSVYYSFLFLFSWEKYICWIVLKSFEDFSSELPRNYSQLHWNWISTLHYSFWSLPMNLYVKKNIEKLYANELYELWNLMQIQSMIHLIIFGSYSLQKEHSPFKFVENS